MIKLSRKVLISVFTLAVTILALGASTFAWFALSTTSQVSNIGGQVTMGEGIEVRLYKDGVEPTPWKSNLSGTDVSNFLGKIKATGFEFKAVTSPDGATNFTKLALDASDGLLKLGQATTINADYLEFQIQFRSQSALVLALTEYEFDDALNPPTKLVIGSSPYWQYDSDSNTGLSAHPVNTKASYGARISFTGGGTTSVYQHIATTPKGLTLVDKAVDPVNDPAINEVEGNYVMGTTLVEVGQWSYLKDGLGLIIHDDQGAVLSALPTTTIADAKTAVKDTNDDYYTQITLANNPTATDDAIKANFGEFTVRLWIEGWDADTYDVILDMPLFVSLEFKKLP